MIFAIKNSWPWGHVTDSLLDTGWLARLARYPALLVGFSGGLDSMVLLHVLAQQPELAGKLRAVHIHHGLSKQADAWLEHCRAFCASVSVPFISRQVEFDRQSNIEEHARKARYAVFMELLDKNGGLVLAHHADDQAETVLLQLFRGAGVDGLAAMPEVKPFGPGDLVRPFLTHTRARLEAYASMQQLSFVEDESNQDISFARNYLRHQVMPLLRSRWPGVVGNLGRSARHCQQAKLNLQALAGLDCDNLASTTLNLSSLNTLDKARITNVLRVWLESNRVRLPPADTFNRLIAEVIFARPDGVPCVEWDGIAVRRFQNKLYLTENSDLQDGLQLEWSEFPRGLQWGNERLQALPAEKGLYVPQGSKVSVRSRKGGERFYWHGQTRVLKKLLQEWQVPPWLRDRLPLIYIDDELVAVAGYAVSDHFFGMNRDHTYIIKAGDPSPGL